MNGAIRSHDSFWGLLKAAKKRLATYFHWGEGAATLLQYQLRNGIENTTTGITLALVATVW